MKRIFLAGAALFALTSVSSAADLAAPVPVDVWSGYYVGIQGGYSFQSLDVETSAGAVLFDDDDYEGGFGGAYWGRNWQSGNWVFGLDGSIQVSAIENDVAAAAPATPDVETELFSASRVRIGYAFDNVLLFAAGGLSIAKVNIDDGTEDEDAYLKGFTVGAGLEYRVADSWSARIEYLYTDYEEEQRTIFPGGDTYLIDVNDAHMVRAGVAYHF